MKKIYLLLIVVIFMIYGCNLGTKQPSHLIETNQPNTFELKVITSWVLFQGPEQVKGVRVYSCNDVNCPRADETICWEIIAEKPVDANRFKVTVGKVPKGFYQVVPPSNEIFVPVSGQTYWISIDLLNELMPWPSTLWISE